MGSKGDGSDAPEVVTMNDLKTLETTLVSSMEANMEEMRQFIMRLSTSAASPPSNSEDTTPQSKETAQCFVLGQLIHKSLKTNFVLTLQVSIEIIQGNNLFFNLKTSRIIHVYHSLGKRRVRRSYLGASCHETSRILVDDVFVWRVEE